MDSILTSIKKLLGITEEYKQFDVDIIMHINMSIAILTQMGIGPDDGFVIQDESANWDDFIPDEPRFEIVKTYIYQRVKMIFDPPLATSAIESMNRMIAELEFRIRVLVDELKREEEIQNEEWL